MKNIFNPFYAIHPRPWSRIRLEDFSSALSSEPSVWLPSYSAQASIYPIIYWHDISSIISYLHTLEVNIWWCGLKIFFLSISRLHQHFNRSNIIGSFMFMLLTFQNSAMSPFSSFLEEYPFTVIIFPSFLLSFDNNGIRFLWNPLPYTKFRFIYNPPTFQKESLKGLWIGLTELVFSQMRLRMVQSFPRQIFGLHNTNMTSIFVSYLQYDSI